MVANGNPAPPRALAALLRSRPLALLGPKAHAFGTPLELDVLRFVLADARELASIPALLFPIF